MFKTGPYLAVNTFKGYYKIQSILFRNRVAIYCENHTKLKNTLPEKVWNS